VGARYGPSGLQTAAEEFVEPSYVQSQPMSRAVVGARYSPQRGAPTPRWTSLREWGIRPKLIIVLSIPTIAALALGGVNMLAALNATTAYGHIEAFSGVAQRVNTLVHALQDERDLTVDQLAQGRANSPPVNDRRAAVDRAVTELRSSLNTVDTSYAPVVQRDVQNALGVLARLAPLRGRTTVGVVAATNATGDYTAIISALLRVNSNLSVGSFDAQFVQRVAALDAISRSGELASQQRALLIVAMRAGGFGGSGLAQLVAARAQQDVSAAAFLSLATPDRVELYRRTVTGPILERADTILRDSVVTNGTKNIGANPAEWFQFKTHEVDSVNAVASSQLQQIIDRARALRAFEQRGAATGGLIIIMILLFALAATVVVARSMIRPLQRLRSAAFEVADHGLPEVVRRLHEGEAQEFDDNIHPVDVAARDEIGQVARAFDEVHAQAVRLAGEQALMRKNMSTMFVNLSRRSQSLVERQLRVIDGLETSEADPDQLASLFTLDLLATRMRRNDENLLVLAGAEGGRRWNHPFALLDVVRAAVAEVEQYARIRTDVELGFEVTSTAVGGVVHLLAELLENAAAFSAPGTAVEIRARSLGASGEIMIEVEDQGIGMTAGQMEEANERLASPPVFDVTASRMMGLYVVARLAQRHDIRVRLRSSTHGGVIALVQLPDRIVLPAGSSSAPSEARHAQPEPAAVAATASGAYPDSPLSDDAGAMIRHETRAQDTHGGSLPIFETVQSEWFVRPSANGQAQPESSPAPAAAQPADEPADRPAGLKPAASSVGDPIPAARRWSSPADEGWRVAQAVSAPVSGGVTTAGLPVRVRGSNLVPGSVPTGPTITPQRPAHAARGLSSFQRGVARGREGGDGVPPPAAGPEDGESVVTEPAAAEWEESHP